MDLKTAMGNILHKIADNDLTMSEIMKLTSPKEEKIPVSEMMGIWKGMIWTSDDFDEPMDWIVDDMLEDTLC